MIDKEGVVTTETTFRPVNETENKLRHHGWAATIN